MGYKVTALPLEKEKQKIRKFLDRFEETGAKSTEIATFLGLSKKNTIKKLNILVNELSIERIGIGTNVRYRLIKYNEILTRLKSIDNLLKENKKTTRNQHEIPNVIIERGYAGIMKRGFNVDKPEFCDVRIVLTITNPTKERIGISKIIVDSQIENYPIPIRMRDWDSGKTMSYFVLKSQETKTVVLFAEGLPLTNVSRIPISVKLYDASQKVIKEIELKLFITGFMVL